ncbi:hypothetical protein ACIBF5_14115 [Micromonospora sp. NPDC050417]|uniref:hypothetical protein n=1 Tax=Micromonospora sp. NPDC050417 TaxID=3364280 RepID=UPI0037B6E711
MRRPRGATFFRRLVRDLSERRKTPGLLVRRGIALARTEPTVLRRQTGLGCLPSRGGQVIRQVAALHATATGSGDTAGSGAGGNGARAGNRA